VGSHLTKGNPRKTEAAEESTATSSHFTTVHQTSRASVTRKHSETDIILLLLQLVTKVCIFCNGLSFALVALYPAFSCHGAGRNIDFGPVSKPQL